MYNGSVVNATKNEPFYFIADKFHEDISYQHLVNNALHTYTTSSRIHALVNFSEIEFKQFMSQRVKRLNFFYLCKNI